MSKKTWYTAGGAVALIVAATLVGHQLTGTSIGTSSSSTTASSDQVITLQVAHTQSYAPYDFINDKGESDGFEVAVLKAVDEKLPTTSSNTQGPVTKIC